MSFGTEVKALRTAKGLTQKQLADAAGMSQAFIARLETGKDADLRGSNLYKLADALGVTCDHFRPFLGAEDVPAPPPPLVGRPAKQPALPKKKGKSDR